MWCAQFDAKMWFNNPFAPDGPLGGKVCIDCAHKFRSEDGQRKT